MFNGTSTRTAKKVHALIVEDDLNWESLWAEVLKEIDADAQYTWVTSEKEAENAITERLQAGEEFDVIITDIFVSGAKTGLDLVEKYQDRFPGRFVVASGVDMNALMKQWSATNTKPALLSKPFSLDECLKVVGPVLKAMTNAS